MTDHEAMRQEWDRLSMKLDRLTPEERLAYFALDRKMREAGVPGFPKQQSK